MLGYELDSYWTQPAARLLSTLEASEAGLSSADAVR